MCTTTPEDVADTIERFERELGGAFKRTPAEPRARLADAAPAVDLIESRFEHAQGSVHITALRWSPLTVRLKQQRARFVDVLVSNVPTWFGVVEHPLHAHRYLRKDEKGDNGVMAVIACGLPRSGRCR